VRKKDGVRHSISDSFFDGERGIVFLLPTGEEGSSRSESALHRGKVDFTLKGDHRRSSSSRGRGEGGEIRDLPSAGRSSTTLKEWDIRCLMRKRRGRRKEGSRAHEAHGKFNGQESKLQFLAREKKEKERSRIEGDTNLSAESEESQKEVFFKKKMMETLCRRQASPTISAKGKERDKRKKSVGFPRRAKKKKNKRSPLLWKKEMRGSF